MRDFMRKGGERERGREWTEDYTKKEWNQQMANVNSFSTFSLSYTNKKIHPFFPGLMTDR